jgi:uncharacterized protein
LIPDINVLVAAARTDHTHHKPAREWLQKALQSGQEIVLLPAVVAGLLRIVTHPKIFVQPTGIVDALAYVDAIANLPQVHIATQELAWPELKQLCVQHELSENDVPDAWLAANVLHMNEHLVSFDRGFRKLLKRSQLTVLSAVLA